MLVSIAMHLRSSYGWSEFVMCLHLRWSIYSCFEAVNAALGRVIASVPTFKVMHVCNAFSSIMPEAVQTNMIPTVNLLDANATAKAFYEFKDVVKAAQR